MTDAISDPTTPRKLGLSRSTNVTIDTSDGRIIAGTLDFPASVGAAGNLPQANLPSVIVIHCFTCDRKAIGTTRISKTLARLGFVSLRIDMEGLGDSSGAMENSTLTRQIDDVVTAAQWLDAQSATPDIPKPGRILVGHSLGGAAVLRACHRVQDVRAVATVGTPYNPAHATASMPKLLERLKEDPSLVSVPIPGRGVNLGRALVENLQQFDPASGAKNPGEHGIASLFLHTPQDDLVPFEHAEQLYRAAKQPASLVSLPGMDHLLHTPGSGQHAAEMIALWAQPLLGTRKARMGKHD